MPSQKQQPAGTSCEECTAASSAAARSSLSQMGVATTSGSTMETAMCASRRFHAQRRQPPPRHVSRRHMHKAGGVMKPLIEPTMTIRPRAMRDQRQHRWCAAWVPSTLTSPVGGESRSSAAVPADRARRFRHCTPIPPDRPCRRPLPLRATAPITSASVRPAAAAAVLRRCDFAAAGRLPSCGRRQRRETCGGQFQRASCAIPLEAPINRAGRSMGCGLLMLADLVNTTSPTCSDKELTTETRRTRRRLKSHNESHR